MSTIKNPTRFAELEYCLQEYFDGKLALVMKQVRDDLTHKQLEERGRYQSSLAGVLASANPYADNTDFVLKQTGKWNSKTTEDYLEMCNQKIWKDKNIVKDLALLAGEWRNAVVKEIGRNKYDALSKACGEDLAYAYVVQRMEDLMIGKLVKDNTPKSTMDYILRSCTKQHLGTARRAPEITIDGRDRGSWRESLQTEQDGEVCRKGHRLGSGCRDHGRYR